MAADGSYMQPRESCFGRARASSVALAGLAPPQRDLTDELLQQQATGAAVTSGAALRVFLRVRPQLDGDFGDLPQQERKPVLEMPNHVHLLMHAPKESATHKNALNGNGKLTHRYTFSHIFPPETDQQRLFRQTTLNHVTEFVNGHSCLLFTYGATNSGKTYTVHGSPSEPGLLPCALDALFNSVSARLYERLDLQPRGFCGVCRGSAGDEETARRLRHDTLRRGGDPELPELAASRAVSEDSLTASRLYRSEDSLASSIDSLAEIRLCPEVEGRVRESAAVSMDNQPNTRFSVWVSYLEIYNECVYDLLERPPSGSRRRTALHLGIDKTGNTFVKGLRHVQVRSADEAIQVVRAGRQSLRFASNRLNHNSSRSHSVFTVRLIRLLDTDNPSVARVSQFSVCDLAGSERVEKTQAAGVRMKEAGNINSSLMVLGRCMKAMRQSQKGPAAGGGGAVLVPYRDSKLTRIFQSYFCGGGLGSRVTMIVNVSPSPIVFDETIQVLKFSALAKQVSIQQPEKRRAPSRFSVMVRRSMQAAAAAVMGRPRPLLDSTGALHDDNEHQNLLDLVESLRHQLVETRRENAGLELRIREELFVEYQQHMVQIETGWQERLQESERYMESRSELQLSAVAAGLKAQYSRKRRRTGDSDDDEADAETEQGADQLQELQERLAASEQRCTLLEQQLEAEAADGQQAAQRASQRQQELTRLASQLTEQRDTNERLQRERDEAEQRHLRLVEGGSAEQTLTAELGRQVAALQQELRFRDMDLRETREYLQEGGDEFLQLEAASERQQRQLVELEQQLAQRDEALRDQLALYADLEQLLAGRSQQVAELEAQLGRRAAAGRPAQPVIPEEEEAQKPADLSFGSRMQALRSKTGAMLRQVAGPQGAAAGRQDSEAELGRAVRTTEEESQTEGDQCEQQQQLTEARAEAAQLTAQLEEQQRSAERLAAELRSATDQLAAKTAHCSELSGQAAALQQQLNQLTEARAELEELQRQYKQALHLKSEAEADAAVCEREMKTLRAELERERHGDGALRERLRARDAEVALLQDSRDQVSEALRIINAELDAKNEELRQNNIMELRAQLQRAEAESGHVRDELEKRVNELLKLNIQLDGLKRQLVERDEDLLKAREERSRSMHMSEQDIRRKNEELNRERHESSQLRDIMARLTPRSSSLQSELESARAGCRRKDDRIEQLEARLRSSQAELAACTPTPTRRRAAGRTRSVQIVGDSEAEECEVTPMVLGRPSRSSRSSRRLAGRAAPESEPTETDQSEGEEERPATGGRRRAASRSAVRFTDENGDQDSSECGSSVAGGGGGRTREPLTAISEQQAAVATPADQLPPPRAAKSTATKRKLFKRCSDQIMECSPVETAERRNSPRKVVTRSLRSRKK